MSNFQDYGVCAPIIEAVIEIRFNGNKRITEVANDLFEESEPGYLEPIPINEDSFKFAAHADKSDVQASSSRETIGYRFLSKDESCMVQLKNNSFVFSQLEPYTGWEVFLEKAKPLLAKYIAIFEPKSCSRIAVRYINKFDFNLPEVKNDSLLSGGFEISDYFRLFPHLPSRLKDQLENFLTTVQLLDKDQGLTTSLSLYRVEPLPDEKTVSIILDSDTFLTDCASAPATVETIVGHLLNVRRKKNDIFELCITDATRNWIKGRKQ